MKETLVFNSHKFTRRELLRGAGAFIAARALSSLIPADALAEESEPSILNEITKMSRQVSPALENQERKSQYKWDEVSVTAEANQFGEGWGEETTERINNAAKQVLEIFGQAYPDELMFYDEVAVRPSTPLVIDYLKQNHPEIVEKSDLSKMSFVVYPGIFKESGGLLSGIYWLGDFKTESGNEISLLTHELFHYVYGIGEEGHNLERFSTFGASWIAEKYLDNGIIPGPDESPLKEIETYAKEAAENPCICYVVKKDDTLWELAREYKITVDEIMRMNKGNIDKPNLIYAGQQIVIPAPGMGPNQFCGCIWPIP